MPDREKVMRGLECCCTHIVGMSCGNCPYEIEQREDEGISDCTSVLAYDALELLKEQPEIVRCKDCKNMKVLPCDIHGHIPIYCTNLSIYSEGLDWFCADGVAKDINVPGKEGL